MRLIIRDSLATHRGRSPEKGRAMSAQAGAGTFLLRRRPGSSWIMKWSPERTTQTSFACVALWFFESRFQRSVLPHCQSGLRRSKNGSGFSLGCLGAPLRSLCDNSSPEPATAGGAMLAPGEAFFAEPGGHCCFEYEPAAQAAQANRMALLSVSAALQAHRANGLPQARQKNASPGANIVPPAAAGSGVALSHRLRRG